MLKKMTPEQAELLVMFEPLLYDMDSEYRIAVDEAREVCAINYDYDTVYWGPRRIAEIVALLSEALPADKFNVESTTSYTITASSRTSRNGTLVLDEEDQDHWIFSYCPFSCAVWCIFFPAHRRMRERKYRNPVFGDDSLTVAKWIISIVTTPPLLIGRRSRERQS